MPKTSPKKKIVPQTPPPQSAFAPLPVKVSKPRKQSQEVNIEIQRMSEQRLIDQKVLGKSDTDNFGKLIAGALLAGILAGGGFLLYLLVFRPSAPPIPPPAIIVPEEGGLEETPPAAPQSEEQPPAETSEVVTQKVEILSTPTGFLNVRLGPGTNFEKIAEVKPGETYELISQDLEKGWYEIKLDLFRAGWVTGQYAKIKD